jgi:hypothetical protein
MDDTLGHTGSATGGTVSAAEAREIERADNGAAPPGEKAAAVGLLPLAPQFIDEQHGLYVRYLNDALTGADRDRYRNIALTGTYGSGKSSILQSLSNQKVISLSLSTLGDEPAGTDASGVVVSTTNRIQKEIVKQLLYREDPADVPNSRYRRIGSFKWVREARLAGLIAASLVLLGYLTRFTDRLINFAGDNPFGRVGMHLGLFIFLALLVFLVRRTFHNRLWVEKFVAGPATLTLSKSGSYFDEYLDEIVYFFEATDYDVVIFEDIDRFNDPHIFETLRELNTLLNNSRQLSRKIRFIYAIKDSIFERLGVAGPFGSEPDAARAEVERANRTKFFDLVIPVVPFITHRSARDHMTDILAGSGLEIARPLVSLVAKHVADMRLIKNIHNEYVVFRERLLLTGDGLPGLSPESVFSMIVYKNIHMSDFEQVRTGTSQLDKLYQAGREFVAEHVKQLDEETLRLRRKLSNVDGEASVSESLGAKLEAYVRRVMRHARMSSTDAFTVGMGAQSFAHQDLRSPAFWRSFVKTKGNLNVQVAYSQTLSFGYNEIMETLGEPFSPELWEKHEREVTNTRLLEIEKIREGLLWADMGDLMGRPETVSFEGQSTSFADLADRHLGSPLARELVAGGYIDRNFSLYAAQFLGVHVSLTAMSFILHNVQPNRMDVNFAFSSQEEIQALLEEVSAAVLNDRCMYNIQILDHLLDNDDARCEPIVRKLSAPGKDEKVLMAAYLARGKKREALYRRMAGYSAGIFHTIVTSPTIADDLRVPLFNASLAGSKAVVDYVLDPTIKTFVEDNYQAMGVLTTGQEDPEAVLAAAGILGRSGVRLGSLRRLSAAVTAAVVAGSLYEISVENLLIALNGPADLALDTIKDKDTTVYEYVLENVERYLPLVVAARYSSITSPDRFLEILEDLNGRDATVVGLVARHAAAACMVQDIRDANTALWPVLAREMRFPPTFSNLAAYVEEVGPIDDALATVLAGTGSIQEYEGADEDEKEKLAVLILNASTVLPDQAARVRLVEQLALENYVEVALINLEPGNLIGLLIRDRIINDTAASFEPALGFDWPTREFAILQSKAFPEYLEPAHVPSKDLGPLLTSRTIPVEVKRAVVGKIEAIGPGASPSALTEAAHYAKSDGLNLDEAAFRVLAEGKADPGTIVALLEPALEALGYTAVEGILNSMGEPYADLTRLGGHHVKLPRNHEHLALARFAQVHGYAKSDNWDKERPELRVFMRKV